ncbi:nicotinate-nucleotide--dimethylbenzimidazole phosphoribosyltransferase [Leptospira fletcheri]|uniref:Nicotinate-nucleotide--dimethylbenzimidazole phosphoribosyltransferase n=1 Tax=Leptospira fletcheri TaxID=2484981 RepID=A0A4R9GLT8_9LEPT|nr:nicotinate-nucleotide--dimethylbenzimidazole phosphoribosyltransferase [Leptospira fletcheri]TGK14063.1 nicotinate-nucleotide--dimethylbenzimidazole phosphoribosyltransferase [Leptospira fletcheri]
MRTEEREGNNSEEPKFTREEKEGLYKAIYTRRDIRSYLSDPIEDEVLFRLLDAAHHAPSVGFTQPWNFLLIREISVKKAVYDHFVSVNEAASKSYEGDRKLKYNSLKLQGILDAPVSILFTCDRNRDPGNLLGRSTNRNTDLYSACLAVQNFWLAAQAEGLGAGWMSIFEPEFIKKLLEIPETVEPIALMTLGKPVWVPRSPILETVGWKARQNLSDLVYENRWGVPSHLSSGTEPEEDRISSNSETLQQRMDSLTKPVGSLGVLEDYIFKICNIQKTSRPVFNPKAILLFAGDHGIAEEGVSAYNRHVTAQMTYMFLSGGAAINSLCRGNGIDLYLNDLGVDHDFGDTVGLNHAKVRRGSRNFLKEPAMTEAETELAIEFGRESVRKLENRYGFLGIGEMGIGNTTSAAAIVCSILGKPPEECVGAGTGVGRSTLEKKIRVIAQGLEKHKRADRNEWNSLVCFGGYEIAAMVGVIEEAVLRGIPVILDGMITGAAALVAFRRNPGVVSSCIAGHISSEPAHRWILEELDLRPVLDLSLALGEGSGAALAMGVLESGCRLFSEMKTFEEANIRFSKNETSLS